MTDRIRWGILSTARIGTEHVIPAMRKTSNSIAAAIASRDLNRGRQVAESLEIDTVHGSYEDLLADDGIDAVYVPLPNHLHRDWTIAAARAGKHVLCEKPMALTAAEAQHMVEVCEAEGVKFMEAFMYRLHPSWVRVRELVMSGTIGELRAVQARFSYFNDDPDDIRNIVDYGGGALMDIGCYPINVARMLYGSEPTSVTGLVRRDPRFGTDVVTTGLMEFGRGQASFICSTQMEPDQRVHILGAEGRLEVEIPFNIPPDREARILLTRGGDPPVSPDTVTISVPPADQYAIELEEFARSILDDLPVPTPPVDGVANMAVIEQILEGS
jgi:predicted dehydrogenase